MWGTKRTTPIQDDIGEAQKIRKEATRDLAKVIRQAPYVSRLTASLIERREQNHFGEQIQITFAPRGTNA